MKTFYIWGGSKFKDQCPYRERGSSETQRHRGEARQDEGGEESDAAPEAPEVQGLPEASAARTDFPSRKNQPCTCQDLDFLPQNKRMHFCGLKPPDLC